MAKAQQTFEKRLERVREITALLESGDLPLEQGVKLFQEGVALSKECAAELEQARIIVESAGQESSAQNGMAPGDEA
ncbi:exodeoxyribonuclease VII small subunit [Desulfomicrobium baculatum]|uniref:Exodeoxyribonuclease 7 small subunit n=1 Tax=Desulfomicrobium baculatum (strain DSM 4028 / VKM B-1378 / X) TaxID=525897 RepID=C7LQ30_DESBD|nr:exodeoxyribonuclease VII small subunit [Desulfomicrobium baculatum]ACU89056.1 Exonuclease VII small subunit [Desulfomicrobium baculatum DSM 4028]